MSDYYSGYSLYRGPRGVPMPCANDWMNPMGMVPGMPMSQQNFFKGTPVRAAESTQRPDRKHAEKAKELEGPRQRVPCSNVPSRTMRRMQMFEARDWTSIQSPVVVHPVDAGIAPMRTVSEAPTPALWQPSIPIHQQYSQANWLRPNREKLIGSRHKGLVAVGESDSDSGKEDHDERECEHDQWMKELVATVNSVMAETEAQLSPSEDLGTRNQFQFEWLHQAKRGGVDLSRD